MTLDEIKNLIFTLPVRDHIKDGYSYTEPYLSVKDGLIIDNFIVYASNHEKGIGSFPITVFGLCASDNRVSYIKNDPESLAGFVKTDVFELPKESDLTFDDLNDLGSSYEKVRSFITDDTYTEEQQSIINEYRSLLERFLPKGYMKIFESICS